MSQVTKTPLYKLAFLFLFALTLIACGSSGPKKPKLYYEGMMLQSTAPKKNEKKNLLYSLSKTLKDRKVFVKNNGKTNRVKTLESLSLAELQALWLSSDKDYYGAELDLKILTSKTESVPVTVWIDLKGEMTVEKGQWKPSAVPSSAQEVEERWKVGPLRAKRGTKWSKRALRSINIALSKLSREELELIRGIPFIRKEKGSSASNAALYIQEGDCDAFIHVYNLAIKSERFTFSGEAKAALPATVSPILHELGHALHFYPYRHMLCEYHQRLDAYNKKVPQANSARGAKRDKLMAELDRASKAIDQLKIKTKKLDGKGPVLMAYLNVRGKKRGPTPYGETSAAESFAESFALFRVDPLALKRVFPKVYEWFKRDGHLKAIKDAIKSTD